MDADHTFAKNLKLLREANRYSQGAFSRRLEDLGLSLAQQSIYKIESGNRRVTIGEAVTIAAALGVGLMRMVTENVGFHAEPPSPADIKWIQEFSELPEAEQERVRQETMNDVLESMTPADRRLYEMQLAVDQLQAQIEYFREARNG